MRILYLSQYFPPEVGATQNRAYEMAHNLVQLGHHVTILAEIPNHPSGVIPPKYRGKLYERVDLDGIDVIRVWVKTSPKKTYRSRMLFYITYMVNAALAGVLLARGRYDLVYATSPPLFVGAAALVLSYIRRLSLVFEVRDLWPEVAIALGEISNPSTIAWATRLEEACYRRASAVVVVTQGFASRLVERGVPENKLSYLPNGANVDLFQFRPEGRARLRSQLSLEGKFIAIYAGIHGVAQGLETLVEAARLLQDDLEIHFLLVGEGPCKDEVKALADHYGLRNFTMLPEQPRESISDYFSAADVALVPLRDLNVFKETLPSKIFDAWACQRPVLLSVPGEARQLLEEACAGLFTPPEQPSALATAIEQLKADPARRERMGANGRTFTEKYFSRRAQAEKLVQLLSRVIQLA